MNVIYLNGQFYLNRKWFLVSKQNHINGIENLESQAKCYLRKFNGVPKVHEFYLKECRWRFNHSDLKYQVFFLKQLVKLSF